jgi:starch synthase
MAMSKAVVGSDIGPIREVVADGETGLLVPPDDPDRLAQAIITLLADEPRRRAMGAAGRRRVEALFDEQTMCERTEAEYRRLLKEKGWPGARG